MTIVSRLQLDHPALGTAGGASLHSAIQSLYQKIGDAIADRYFVLSDFDNGETEDLLHNYVTDISNIRYDLYYLSGGAWIQLTESTTPKRSQFTVIEKVGFEDTTLQITNASGVNDLTLAVVMTNDPLFLREDDIKDIDISTTAPEDGQALVYEASSGKFKPGASGDASFKIQSVASDGTIVVKGGYLIDDAGIELATYDGSGSVSTDFGKDITFDLDSLVASPVNSTTYYLYIDRTLLSSAVTLTDNSRKLVAVTGSQFVALTTVPDSIVLERYIPIGFVRRATGVWSTTIFGTLAFRRHQNPSALVNPQIYEDADHSIGTVGSAGQLATYGGLSESDFSNGATERSHYPLNSNASDGSTNGRTLTATGSPSYIGVGFFGRENVVKISSGNILYGASSSFFSVNTGTTAFSCGGWVKLDDWGSSANKNIFSLHNSTNTALAFDLYEQDSSIKVQGNAGVITSSVINWEKGSWHHIAITANGSNVYKLYLDGQLAATGTFVTTGTLSTNDFVIGAQRNAGTVNPAPGLYQDIFFTNPTQLTDSQINVLYSKRFKGQQIAGGHALAASSFQLASLSNKVSFFNLSTDANDGSVNAKNLTNTGSIVFNSRLNLFGDQSCAGFDGATQHLSYTADSFFIVNPKQKPFAFGGWFAADDWTPASNAFLMSFGSSGAVQYLYINTDGRLANNDGTGGVDQFTSNPNFVDGSWHHIAFVCDMINFYVYIDGVLAQTNPIASAATSPTGNTFTIGRYSAGASNWFKGRASNVFFAKDILLSAQDIQKLFSTKITPSVSLPAKLNQNWVAKFISEDGFIGAELADSWVVDKDDTQLFANFGGGSASRVNIRLFDEAIGARTIPVRSMDKNYTSNPFSGNLLAHGLPSRPSYIRIWHNENADGRYRDISADVGVKADGTNLYADLSSYTIDATHDIQVVASVGVPATSFETGFKSKTANYTAANGDKILTDSSGGAFTVTLPASPGIGHTVELYDTTESWVPNAVTLGRNGEKINGLSADYSLNFDGGGVKVIYTGSSQGWRVYP